MTRSRLFRSALCVCLAALLPCSALAQSSTPAATPTAADVASLDAGILEQMEAGGLVGLAAAIIVDGKVTWRGGYGFADRESRTPFTSATVMNIASISKTVTGAAMMRAVEQGKLSLDADIDTVLPFAVRNPRHPDTPITLRQLATHTSSLVDRWPVYAGTYHFGRDAPQSLGAFLAGYLVPGGADYAPDNFLDAAPGARREYSNIGAGLAGFAIERATGQPLDAYTRAQIFAPLGMDHTHWHLADAQGDVPATLYLVHDDISVAIRPYAGTTWPDGGLRTSVDDLSRFFIALLDHGEYAGKRILKRESVDAMLRMQFTAGRKPDNVDVAEKNSGLFWQTKFDTQYVGHGGSDPGLKTEMLATPDLRSGVILFTNTAGEGTDKAYVAILKMLFARAQVQRATAAP